MDARYFDSLMQEIEKNFTVALIAQPVRILDDEFQSDDLARELRFSQLFLKSSTDSDSESVWVLTYDPQENFKRTERRELKPIDILSEATPLSQAIALLADRPFYLVMRHNRIDSLVTQSDLNHLPVRTYLFTLIAHTEGLLAEWIQRSFLNSDYLSKLSENSQKSIQELYKTKKAMDFDTRLIDCTTLIHKLTIVSKTDWMRSALGYPSKASLEEAKSRFNRLRGRLHHGMTPLPPALVPTSQSNSGFDSADDDSDVLGDAIAHNGQLVWDQESTQWLNQCTQQLLDWIPLITTAMRAK